MALPIDTTYAPMEGKLVAELPAGTQWQYEPKFDGFRCLAFKDGAVVDLRLKSGQPFNRYFPEVVAALEALRARCFVLDGELVVPAGDALSFDELLMRIHPAKSRVDKLSREHPALFVVFDLLVDDEGKALVGLPLAERRAALESVSWSVTRPAMRSYGLHRRRSGVKRLTNGSIRSAQAWMAEHRAQRRMGATCYQARRRSAVRPLQRRPLSARHKVSAVAAG